MTDKLERLDNSASVCILLTTTGTGFVGEDELMHWGDNCVRRHPYNMTDFLNKKL